MDRRSPGCIARIRSHRTLPSSYDSRVSLATLSEKTGASYEHLRKLAKGLAFPSPGLLAVITKELGITRVLAERAIARDKVQKKFGPQMMLNSVAQGDENPELEEIERAWQWLTLDQRRMITTTVQAFARENRKKRS